MTVSRLAAPELWGGLECTIARIGDRYRDQFAETGHHDRLGDLDLIAELGIRTLRYPVLWEAISGETSPARGWEWHDERLGRLRQLGIEPIVGLIHHGSGPRDTDLLDEGFADRLAQHARCVAERYPRVTRYTPVNEPLTTARFSALYGHWYPHRQSLRDFLRALVNQCRAVVLAMRSIRRVNPAAQLIQTEDIGRIFSTPMLAGQAAYENDRRWLSLDLLFGRVRPDHPWWSVLTNNGIRIQELEEFWSELGPDLIGVNHYLTSDRYLDEDVAAYPGHLVGGNERQRYADVEAVRIRGLQGLTGPLARLREVAARYRAPIAVTEVHHGSTRDEQLRWLRDVWDAALAIRSEGVDLRAVTIWSMFGAVDWNSLLTRTTGIYEPGVFDVRGPVPRPTALAHAAASLTSTGRFTHPVLDHDGWWKREDRFYSPRRRSYGSAEGAAIALIATPGAFSDEFIRIAGQRGLNVKLAPPDCRSDEHRSPPANVWAIFDAALTDDTTSDFAALRLRLTSAVTRALPYVFLSGSDVFDGRVGVTYSEADRLSPVTISGRLRASSEAVVKGINPGALILRGGILFGPSSSFRSDPDRAVPSLAAPFGTSGCYSYVPDLIHIALDLLIDRDTGVRHLVNGAAAEGQATSWAGIGVPRSRVHLRTDRGDLMPPLESALARFQAAKAPGVLIAKPSLQAAE